MSLGWDFLVPWKEGNYMKKLFLSQKFKTEIKDISLVLIGCLLLALADAIFIMPCNIIL